MTLGAAMYAASYIQILPCFDKIISFEGFSNTEVVFFKLNALISIFSTF